MLTTRREIPRRKIRKAISRTNRAFKQFLKELLKEDFDKMVLYKRNASIKNRTFYIKVDEVYYREGAFVSKGTSLLVYFLLVDKENKRDRYSIYLTIAEIKNSLLEINPEKYTPIIDKLIECILSVGSTCYEYNLTVRYSKKKWMPYL